ncbi:MAG: hypothetical protein ACI8P9_001792 [Parasphingorhabdus sp.]|jgi:hypothetical protein
MTLEKNYQRHLEVSRGRGHIAGTANVVFRMSDLDNAAGIQCAMRYFLE